MLFTERCFYWYCISARFFKQVQSLRGRSIPSDTLADVYDARVWQDFITDKYDKFLMHPGNLLLSLDCDWFQPFNKANRISIAPSDQMICTII